ncbi:MAG: hypothetical protein U0132_22080 [Gemmatimonadaceae bacterium]
MILAPTLIGALLTVLTALPVDAQYACVTDSAKLDSAEVTEVRGYYRLVLRLPYGKYGSLIDSADIELRPTNAFLASHTRSIADSTLWVAGSHRPVWGTFLTPLAQWRVKVAPPDSMHPAITLSSDGVFTATGESRGMPALSVQLRHTKPEGFGGTVHAGGFMAVMCDRRTCAPREGTLCAYAIPSSARMGPEDIRPPASPPILNTKAFSVGVGYTVGALGLEWVQRHGLHAASALGVGAAGIGGRVIWHPWLMLSSPRQWTPYVSPGFVLVPWKVVNFSGAGMVGGEVGLQRWGADGGWFADVGVGAATVVRGTWRGDRVVPTVRVMVGRASW